jgi:hypothetical protein
LFDPVKCGWNNLYLPEFMELHREVVKKDKAIFRYPLAIGRLSTPNKKAMQIDTYAQMTDHI